MAAPDRGRQVIAHGASRGAANRPRDSIFCFGWSPVRGERFLSPLQGSNNKEKKTPGSSFTHGSRRGLLSNAPSGAARIRSHTPGAAGGKRWQMVSLNTYSTSRTVAISSAVSATLGSIEGAQSSIPSSKTPLQDARACLCVFRDVLASDNEEPHLCFYFGTQGFPMCGKCQVLTACPIVPDCA